eukprot:3165724-Amphidinium_carterae.1
MCVCVTCPAALVLLVAAATATPPSCGATTGCGGSGYPPSTGELTYKRLSLVLRLGGSVNHKAMVTDC